MNRLILIGNGFDLAHGLNTKYQHFIEWYWNTKMEGYLYQWYQRIKKSLQVSLEDDKSKSTIYLSLDYEAYKTEGLVEITLRTEYRYREELLSRLDELCRSKEERITFIKNIRGVLISSEYGNMKLSKNVDICIKPVSFFVRINKSISSKGWVDIEYEYSTMLKDYSFPIKLLYIKDGSPRIHDIKILNDSLRCLKTLLAEYLKTAEKNIPFIADIKTAIYAPFVEEEMSSKEGVKALNEHINRWKGKDKPTIAVKTPDIKYKQVIFGIGHQSYTDSEAERLPDNILLLNFNYTTTAKQYLPDKNEQKYLSDRGSSFGLVKEIPIHGDLNNPESIIFGYGDETGDDFQKLLNLNENECLKNIKSYHYKEETHYDDMMRFIESAPFQVVIMGHSCGISDRVLLNTIFEHPNCVSIKPYYYIKNDGTDDYTEKVQNISRCFDNMIEMRNLIVSKDHCQPLPQYS